MKEGSKKHKNRERHHNPPRWWTEMAKIDKKSFYKDGQRIRMVKPKEHAHINSFYPEQMRIAEQIMPQEHVIWRETRVISKNEVQKLKEVRAELAQYAKR